MHIPRHVHESAAVDSDRDDIMIVGDVGGADGNAGVECLPCARAQRAPADVDAPAGVVVGGELEIAGGRDVVQRNRAGIDVAGAVGCRGACTRT